MKKTAVLSIMVALVFALHRPILAHELVTDGSIGAVLHVEPEDDPLIGQTSSLYFEFKDKTNKFDPAKCDCNATISLNGKELLKRPLYTPGTTNLRSANFTFIFPQMGKYTIEASGTPREMNVFQPFHLKYEVAAERTGTNQQGTPSSSTMYKWIAVIIVILVFAGLLLLNRKKSRTSKK